jgi:predicted NBD/HSP70 family sugar kinase
LLDEMAAHMNAPVLIENDVNAAVYGELSRQSAEDLVFLSVGSGVGMGLVLDGKLRRGPQFTAGEIGMVPYGEPTAMGLPRSVEGYIGLDALKRRFGFDRQFGAQAMDPDARAQMVGSLADVLGHIIAVTSALLNVSDFVLGGLTPDALGEELFEAVRRRAGALSPFPVALRGQSLNSPTLVGAARRVLDAQIGALLALDGEKNGKREERALSSGNRENIDEKEF